jgi:hypothetical protein
MQPLFPSVLFGSSRKPVSGHVCGTAGRLFEGLACGILAWLSEKFTRIFSIGKYWQY